MTGRKRFFGQAPVYLSFFDDDLAMRPGLDDHHTPVYGIERDKFEHVPVIMGYIDRDVTADVGGADTVADRVVMNNSRRPQVFYLKEIHYFLERGVIEKITVYDDKLTIEFKSGVEIDIEK